MQQSRRQVAPQGRSKDVSEKGLFFLPFLPDLLIFSSFCCGSQGGECESFTEGKKSQTLRGSRNDRIAELKISTTVKQTARKRNTCRVGSSKVACVLQGGPLGGSSVPSGRARSPGPSGSTSPPKAPPPLNTEQSSGAGARERAVPKVAFIFHRSGAAEGKHAGGTSGFHCSASLAPTAASSSSFLIALTSAWHAARRPRDLAFPRGLRSPGPRPKKSDHARA